jgi:hypothetical protein
MTISGVKNPPQMLGKADDIYIDAGTVCQDLALANVSARQMEDELRRARGEAVARERCHAAYRTRSLTPIAYVPPARAEAMDPPESAAAAPLQAGEAPSTILEQIKQAAASRYPDDFSTQEYVIKRESQAYEDLQGYSASGVPDNILNQIKNQAEKRFPTDYSTQKYVIEREINSYRNLNR